MLLTLDCAARRAARRVALAGVGGLGLAAVVGAAPAAAAADRPTVIATMSIWADVVDQVDCGDAFDVQSLVPVGGDPHSYEPSMQDRDRLGDAAVIVVNGGGLEAGLIDTVDAVSGDVPVLTVTDHVTTHSPTVVDDDHAVDVDDHVDDAHDHDDGDDHDTDDHDTDDHDTDDHDGHDHDGADHDTDDHDGHDHDGADPHVWLDPTLVAEAVPAIAAALIDAGADAPTTEECAAAVVTSLDELDAEIAALVDTIPPDRRLLVTNHDALGYFARRYGFEVLGSVLPSTSTLVEASPAELDALADAIERAGVPAIFAEALEAADDATALADRLGVEVVTLYTDALGEDGSGADTYQAMLLHDATLIVDALGRA